MTRPRHRLVLAWLIVLGAGLLTAIVIAALLTPANRAYLTGGADHERVVVTGIEKATHSCGRGTGDTVLVARASDPSWVGRASTCGHHPKVGAKIDVWHLTATKVTLADPRSTVILAGLLLLVLIGSGVYGVRRMLRLPA